MKTKKSDSYGMGPASFFFDRRHNMTDESFYALRPTQPYFEFDTTGYMQQNHMHDGISCFYQFSIISGKKLRLVPDACIDLLFVYDSEGKMESYVAGTKLLFETEESRKPQEIFGIRFMPGKHPDFLSITMKDLLHKKHKTEQVLNCDKNFLDKMALQSGFEERIRTFTDHFSFSRKTKQKNFGKKELLQAVKEFVYESSGKIKIHDLEEKTGYTERYINKIFIDEMGFSPKTFCKIIQFQKALETLNSGRPKNMTETSVNLGYYDQSQFIRDFTKFCGTTPLKYLKMKSGKAAESEGSRE